MTQEKERLRVLSTRASLLRMGLRLAIFTEQFEIFSVRLKQKPSWKCGHLRNLGRKEHYLRPY